MYSSKRRAGIVGGTLKVIGVLCLLGWGMMLLDGTCAEMRDATDPIRTSHVPAAKLSKRPKGFDASPTKRKERERFITKMISEGFWERTEFTGSLPKVWVTEEFLRADEKAQNETLEVAYAYWMGELDDFGANNDLFWDPLILKIDNGTILGKRIGDYTPLDGFSR